MLSADLSILQSLMPNTDLTRLILEISRTRENFWRQHSNGMLDDETYSSYRETLLLTLAGSRLAAWNASKSYLVPGFVAEIDEELGRRGP
jgi:hypothetical protein